jgi:hypothetical protein
MDPFRLCLAFGPPAIYLLLLGAINLSRRPLLVSGTRDAATLGLAVMGLVIVGPIELFFPVAAAGRFGAYVWVFLLALYFLCLVLVMLMLRPRLIIYNISTDKLRPILADLVERLDGDARWAGDNLAMPRLGVQLHIDGSPILRNVSLVAGGPNQNQAGWRRLERALGDALREFAVPRHALLGTALVVAAVLTAAGLINAIVHDPQLVLESLFEMLRT